LPPWYTKRCTIVAVSRTNIDIDDELVEKAMKRYRLDSKRAAVDLALRRLVGEAMTKEEVLAMEGTGWDGDLDEMRNEPIDEW
jgi:Arc/MetJ family transcription regulator